MEEKATPPTPEPDIDKLREELAAEEAIHEQLRFTHAVLKATYEALLVEVYYAGKH